MKQKQTQTSTRLFLNPSIASGVSAGRQQTSAGLASQIEKLREGNDSLRIALRTDTEAFLNKFTQGTRTSPGRRISVRD